MLSLYCLTLEKAYENTWKSGIVRDIYNVGLRGRLPCLSRNFSKTENFKFDSVHATPISLIRKWAYLKTVLLPLRYLHLKLV